MKPDNLTPTNLWLICDSLRTAATADSANRAKINQLFDGFPPYTPEEEKKYNVKVNANFLEGTRHVHYARSTIYNALVGTSRFFDLRLRHSVNPDMDDVWVSKLTQIINDIIRSSPKYHETLRSQIAQDVLHGRGVVMWTTLHDDWCPISIALDDFLVPTNARVGLYNVSYFAVYCAYSLADLVSWYNSKSSGWRKDALEKVWRTLKEDRVQQLQSFVDTRLGLEEISQLLRINSWTGGPGTEPLFYGYDFFYWSDNPTPGWYRIILANPGRDLHWAEILYQSNTPYIACDEPYDGLCRIVNVHFADLSSVGPLKYYNVRGLGYMLYTPCHFMNRFLSRLLESAYENTLLYFRVASPDQITNALKVELVNMGFIDNALQFVTPDQRHRPDPTLMQLAITSISSQIAQSVSPYIGHNPEEYIGKSKKTQLQVLAELQMMSSLLGTALTQLYHYQTLQYREIVRRFLYHGMQAAKAGPLYKAPPPFRRFIEDIMKAQIPVEYFDDSLYDIQINRSLGDGNRVLQMQIAQQLQALLPMLPPTRATSVLRDIVLAITGDPDRATYLVPPDKEQPVPENVQRVADDIVALTLAGVPVEPNDQQHILIVPLLLNRLLSTVAARLQNPNVQVTQEFVYGLMLLAQHIAARVQLLSEQEQYQAAASQYKALLDKAVTLISQLQAVAQQTTPDIDLAKIQAKIIELQTKLQTTEAQLRAKLQYVLQSAALRVAQKRLLAQAEVERNSLKTELEKERMITKAANEKDIGNSQ